MKLRIYLFMALVVLVNATAFAKDDNPEDYHMRGILFDGTEVEGYNETNFNNFIHP